METEKPDIWFVYDGECPICQMGANLFKVRQAVGKLHTIDARTQKTHPIMSEIQEANLNLDKGMVLKYEGRLYQGDEALIVMADIGDSKDAFNGLNRMLFRSRTVSKICYPFMKLARDMALKMKGIKQIKNLEQ